MQAPKSSFGAADRNRPGVIPVGVLATFVVVVLVAMVLMYPYRTLVQYSLSSSRGDPLTVAYLRNLIRTAPDNDDIRFSLVEQYTRGGLLDEAREVLAPLRRNSAAAQHAHALWLDWNLLEQQASRTSPGDLSLAAIKAELRDTMYRLASLDDLPVEDRVQLARKAMAYGEVSLTRSIFLQLANGEEAMPVAFYATEADRMLAAGDYDFAKELYLIASRRADRLDDKRQHFLSAVRALMAADRIGAAIEMAVDNLDDLDDLADDVDTLHFLVGVARAAGRPELADQLARRMLRLSVIEGFWRMHAEAPARLMPVVLDAAPEPLDLNLPFDETIYRAAFDAFVDSQALDDAWLVARAAVRVVPEDDAWLLRLARVSDWTGRPEEALKHWLALARRTDSDEAWQSVLRIAPGLFEDEPLLLALQRQFRIAPSAELLVDIVALYERLAEPERGIAYLQTALRGSRNLEHLHLLAGLAERAGDFDTAQDTLARIEALSEGDLRISVRRAAMLVQRGALNEAMAVIDSASDQARPNDLEFWRFTASLALLLNQRELARKALSVVIDANDASEYEYADLIELVRRARPQEAARLAEQGWQRFGTATWLQRTLDLYTFVGDLTSVGRIIRTLTPAQARFFDGNAPLLQARARWHLDHARKGAALADLEAAIAADPFALAPREALLWALIDGNDTVALTQLLARHEDEWARLPGLHDVLGAAWQALSKPAVALQRYWLPRVASHRNDFLWLMNFSDALEQNGEVDRAWRIRAELLRARAFDPSALSAQALDETRRVAQLRLVRAQRRGDPQLALLRELIRMDAEADKPSPQVREMVLSWFIDQGDPAGTRGFLWQQYAASLMRPLWAEITAALAGDDVATIGKLLDRWDARLPRYDRVNAAHAVDDPALAATAAFDTMNHQRDDLPLHLQLTRVMLDQADRLMGQSTHRDVQGLRETEGSASALVALTPHLKLRLDSGNTQREVTNRRLLRRVPDERMAALALTWTSNEQRAVFSLGHRRGFVDTRPMSLTFERQLSQRWRMRARLASDEPATESLGLRVAGMRDQASLQMTWRFARDTRAVLSLEASRYETQTGIGLGDGRFAQLELLHTVRTDLPDLEASVRLANYGFNAAGGLSPRRLREFEVLTPQDEADPGFFLPQAYTVWGVRLTHNIRLREDYTRAIRPFASIDLNRSTTAGTGYGLEAGLAGSVVGTDHLALGLRLEKGGGEQTSRTREVFIDYQHYF